MIVSGVFYTGRSEYVEQQAVAKIEKSQRAQGPALIATRDAGAKFLTRFVFLVLFVFFVRTRRDLRSVVAILVAALLFTYFSVEHRRGTVRLGNGTPAIAVGSRRRRVRRTKSEQAGLFRAARADAAVVRAARRSSNRSGTRCGAWSPRSPS